MIQLYFIVWQECELKMLHSNLKLLDIIKFIFIPVAGKSGLNPGQEKTGKLGQKKLAIHYKNDIVLAHHVIFVII